MKNLLKDLMKEERERIGELEKGTFLERENRFIVKVKIKGKVEKAYLPNPGRLWEILVRGKTLYLEFTKKNKIKYKVLGAQKGGKFILLNTQYANLIFEKIIKKGLEKSFKGFEILKKEAKFKNHRFDFLIKKGKNKKFLEVKSCTLFGKNCAMFPDAITKRGKNHIETLGKIKGIVVFLIYNPKIKFFLPDFHTDPQFSKTLYENRKKIKIVPLLLDLKKNLNFKVLSKAKIPWKTYEREAKNSGIYLIEGNLDKNKIINIGKKGNISFLKGWYLYVGSGKNCLKERIKRHFSLKKKKFWHIDFLSKHLKNLKSFPIYSSRNLECLLAYEFSKIFKIKEGFGSSDCKCKSHLFYSKKEFLKDENFIKILLHFRIDYLFS